ncbi:hypothetical protein GCM10009535_32780 [Streptomyces thermocarboxydovorans]|uniref:Uncharacterized protein n=1 Tax=Streptomyces thermocarboxydovorans TaxID=59298 RepID=A0ABP3SML1_9ACTN
MNCPGPVPTAVCEMTANGGLRAEELKIPLRDVTAYQRRRASISTRRPVSRKSGQDRSVPGVCR